MKYEEIVKELEERIFRIEETLNAKYQNIEIVNERLREDEKFYNEILNLLFEQCDKIKGVKNA